MTAESTNRILLVEDNVAEVFLLRQGMLAAGMDFHLDHAPDGPSALDYLSNPHTRNRPHLLILDLHMPMMSGAEVIQAVRGLGLSIPIAVVSSFVPDSDRRHLLDMGALAFFEKPRDLDSYVTLGRSIRELCESQVGEGAAERKER